jgi:GMP synthase-like glutamine amidotransferase
MVKHEFGEIYGCLFHPEVMNAEIILNFTLKT